MHIEPFAEGCGHQLLVVWCGLTFVFVFPTLFHWLELLAISYLSDTTIYTTMVIRVENNLQEKWTFSTHRKKFKWKTHGTNNRSKLIGLSILTQVHPNGSCVVICGENLDWEIMP
jgi:hypothetical protein